MNRSWPHLLNTPVQQAVAAIKNDDPNLVVISLPEGSPVTYDLQPFRVRVFYNESGLVSSVPSTG